MPLMSISQIAPSPMSWVVPGVPVKMQSPGFQGHVAGDELDHGGHVEEQGGRWSRAAPRCR